MSASRRIQALSGPRQPGGTRRRLLSLPIRLVLAVSTLLMGMVGTAAVASAHHADITAASNCQNGTAQVSYTATAWKGTTAAQRTNHQVEVAYSTSGQSGPWTVVVSNGQFISPDFAFSGAFTPNPDTAGTTVTVRVEAKIDWVDGASGGGPHYALDVVLKTGCSPVSVALPCPTSFGYGKTTTFTANASGGAKPYTYQWTLGTTPLPSTSAYATVTLGSSKDVLTVRVTDHMGVTATSQSTGCLGFYPIPIVTLECPAGGFVFGQPATWTALGKPAVNTDSLTFQWFRNGAAITGAHQATYAATLTSSGDALSVTVTETFADSHKTTSRPATAGEGCRGSYPNPTVSIECPSTGFVLGQTATWTANATAAVTGDMLSYRWLLNGKVAGTDNRKLTTTLNSATDTLSVSVKETFADAQTTASAPASAACQGAHPKPVVVIHCPASFTFGQPATWTAAATPGAAGDKLSYRWTVNGTVVGANSSSLTTALNSATDTLSVAVSETFADAKTSSASAVSGCTDAPAIPAVVPVTDTDVASPSSVIAASSPSTGTGTLPFTGSSTLPLFALAMGLIGAGLIVLRFNGNLKGRGIR